MRLMSDIVRNVDEEKRRPAGWTGLGWIGEGREGQVESGLAIGSEPRGAGKGDRERQKW